jgi:NodT family efflux transporter outer membrane factor (OMF) lipoprotein
MKQPLPLSGVRMLAAAAILALLAGCAVGPDYRPPQAPQAQSYTPTPLSETTVTAPVTGGEAQRFRNAGEIPAEWWHVFQSPALDSLIRQGLAGNPNLDAAKATLRQAQENLNAGLGVLYPAVSAGGTAMRERTTLTQAGTPAPQSMLFNLYNASVNVSYAADIFGASRRQLEALRSQVDYEAFQLRAAHLALSANIVTAAVHQAALRRRIAETQEIIADEEKQTDLVERQFQAGAVARADLLAQRTQLAQTRATLPPLELQLAQTGHQLSVLAGALPSEAGVPDFDLDTLHLPADLPVSLPSALVRQRPDIRAAEALLHEASAEVGVATANLYPQISLTGSFGSQANRGQDLFRESTHVWSLGASIAEPLFNGGALRARRRAAEAAYDQAAAQYRAVVLQAFQNVADTLRALETDARTLQALAEAETMAQQSQRLAEVQFRAGAVNYQTLLNAQRQYLQARISLVDAQAARFADTAALFQAMGGGWWQTDGTTAAD